MRLRYTGPAPVSFPALGTEVEPGAEFDAPGDLAEGFLRRPDVERVEDPPPAAVPKGRRPKDPDPTDEPAGPGPELTEEADGAVPDHS